jgi:hypothetical protein
MHNSIDARPRIKKVRPKHPASSTVVPTIPASPYSPTQTISAKISKLKRLVETRAKERRAAQKVRFAKVSQVNSTGGA